MFNLKQFPQSQKEKALGDESTIANSMAKFEDVIKGGGYKDAESFVNLPNDKDMIGWIKSLTGEKVTDNLKYVFVCGMGGSVTGARAVYDACFGYYDNLQIDRFPKMIFADSLNGDFFAGVEKLIKKHASHPEEILLIIVSKSGNTPETVVQGEIIAKILKESVNGYKERIVVISDEDSPLAVFAGREEVASLSVPKLVGGRYSILSAAGLFPLSCTGLDINLLLGGALEARDNGISQNVLNNQSLFSSLALFEAMKSGKVIHDLFFFHPALESLGKWCRALYSESLGKLKNKDGKEVRAGFTTTVSIGPADLHSVIQLDLGGPKDKFTSFISASSSNNIKVERISGFQEENFSVYEKDTAEILSAIRSGVVAAYKKSDLPFLDINMGDITENSLGYFLMTKMMETVYLAELMKINAFDQPEVEIYKKGTRKMLE